LATKENLRAAIITQSSRRQCARTQLFQCFSCTFLFLPSSCDSRTLYSGPAAPPRLSTSASAALSQVTVQGARYPEQFQKLVNNVPVGDLTTILKGDLNFDGMTNLSDMAILRSAIAGSGSGSSFNLTALNNVGVPEPATWLVGTISLGGFLATIRRKRIASNIVTL